MTKNACQRIMMICAVMYASTHYDERSSHVAICYILKHTKCYPPYVDQIMHTNARIASIYSA